MTKESFEYLWEQGIVKAAKDVFLDIPEELIRENNVVLDVSCITQNKVYDEYNRFRGKVRNNFFDVGENDENLIDCHKICACITGALLNVHLVSYNKRGQIVPLKIVYSNYAIAFYSAIYVLYLIVLSDYMFEGDIKSFDNLRRKATFEFPNTNPGHDAYDIGRIKTLALNDAYGYDFDILSYADMLFWIEQYNKSLVKNK